MDHLDILSNDPSATPKFLELPRRTTGVTWGFGALAFVPSGDGGMTTFH
ncbi:MAG: hypothetical protein L3J95_04650 [Thermoplasmata archaeon]|nr:hypothetical protein [Thermoplasmata archaeon]MCI4359695.1 hypothetical protein [Thermoplasmata archaeon]